MSETSVDQMRETRTKPKEKILTLHERHLGAPKTKNCQKLFSLPETNLILPCPSTVQCLKSLKTLASHEIKYNFLQERILLTERACRTSESIEIFINKKETYRFT